MFVQIAEKNRKELEDSTNYYIFATGSGSASGRRSRITFSFPAIVHVLSEALGIPLSTLEPPSAYAESTEKTYFKIAVGSNVVNGRAYLIMFTISNERCIGSGTDMSGCVRVFTQRSSDSRLSLLTLLTCKHYTSNVTSLSSPPAIVLEFDLVYTRLSCTRPWHDLT